MISQKPLRKSKLKPDLLTLCLINSSRLEKLLNSRIATTSKLTTLRQVVKQPTEETWTYKKLDQPIETVLHREIADKFGDMKVLLPVLQYTKQATSELGIWCADQVWAKALSDDVLPKLEASIDRENDSEAQSPEVIQEEISRVEKIRRIVKSHPQKSPLDAGQLSSKVELLLELFRHHFAKTDEPKCIVFTEQRNTAKVLLELCEKLEIPNLRPGVLVGVRSIDLTARFTFRQQFLALMKFRKGELNCLVGSVKSFFLDESC